LNVAIRIISIEDPRSRTLDRHDNNASTITRDYIDGVTRNLFICVSFNTVSQHYVAIAQAPLTQLNHNIRQTRAAPLTQSPGPSTCVLSNGYEPNVVDAMSFVYSSTDEPDAFDVMPSANSCTDRRDAVEFMSVADLNTTTYDVHCVNYKRQNTALGV
jgi:hypothetical protein